MADQLLAEMQPLSPAAELRLARRILLETEEVAHGLRRNGTDFDALMRYKAERRDDQTRRRDWKEDRGWQMLEVPVSDPTESKSMLLLGLRGALVVGEDRLRTKRDLPFFKGGLVYLETARRFLINRKDWPEYNPHLIRAGLARVAIVNGLV